MHDEPGIPAMQKQLTAMSKGAIARVDFFALPVMLGRTVSRSVVTTSVHSLFMCYLLGLLRIAELKMTGNWLLASILSMRRRSVNEGRTAWPIYCGLTAILLCHLARAQTPSLGVSVTGVVQDPSGAVLIQLAVTLRPLHSGGPAAETTTNAVGEFRFEGVLPGTYRIEAAPRGFAAAALTITVARRPARNLRLTAKLAPLKERLTVTPAPAQVDLQPGNNRDAIALRRGALRNLPVFDADYVWMLSRFLQPDDLGTGRVTLIVDGVEAKKVPVAPSAIRSIEIGADPYSAASARPGRGRIEVETASGKPEFHGELSATFRDSRLDARNAFAVNRPLERRRIFEGSLAGPIGHGKINTFEVSAEHASEDLQAIVFAMGNNGPIRQTLPTPRRHTQFEALIDHRGSPKNDLSLRFTIEDESSVNQGVGGLTLAGAAASSHDREEQLMYHQRTLFTPNLVNQFSFRVGHDWNPTNSVRQEPGIVVQGAFIGGGAQLKELEGENHVMGADGVTWVHGLHTVSGGIDVPDWSNHRYDNFDNFGGTFYFDNLQDYLLKRPFLYTQQQGNGHLEILRKLLGLYVQDQIQARPDLTVTAGVRFYWQNYFPATGQFAPRFSFVYAPGKDRRTVVRGGAGVFYDRFDDDHIAEFLHYQGQGLQQYILTQPAYPNPLAPGQTLAAEPTTLERFAPGIRMPYIIQSSLGVERQLGKATLAVYYIDSRDIHLFLSRDANAPPPPLYQHRPNPMVGRLRQIESAGRGTRDSVEVTLRGQLTHRLSGLSQYSYSRAYDNTDGVEFFPANQYSFDGEWGRSSHDQRHRLNLAETFSAGKGFKLGAVLALYSGLPYTITLGSDAFNDGMSNARPPGVQRNSLLGPGYASVDFDLSREFALTRDRNEGPKLNLSLSAFNAFNHANYESPVGNLQSPFFRSSVAAEPPRRLQLGLRFEF